MNHKVLLSRHRRLSLPLYCFMDSSIHLHLSWGKRPSGDTKVIFQTFTSSLNFKATFKKSKLAKLCETEKENLPRLHLLGWLIKASEIAKSEAILSGKWEIAHLTLIYTALSNHIFLINALILLKVGTDRNMSRKTHSKNWASHFARVNWICCPNSLYLEGVGKVRTSGWLSKPEVLFPVHCLFSPKATPFNTPC